jgi:rhamnogalacturonan endolyase
VNRTGDIDSDGRDEVILGAYSLDDDGTALWSTFEGHGDRMQLTDIDPSRPGLELWYCQEGDGYYQHPVSLRSAASGSLIFGPNENWGAVLRVMAADIDPTYPGMELWSTYGTLYDAEGDLIGENFGTCNFAIYWDADPLRELFDNNASSGYDLYKWNWEQQTLDLFQSFDGEFVGHADVFGDWREEIIMAGSGEIRIHTTTIPARLRLVTLMQDPIYRLSVAAETMGSMQSTGAGYFIGDGMKTR